MNGIWLASGAPAATATLGIHDQSLQAVVGDAAPGAPKQAVEAATCDACGHDLKTVHIERDAHVGPVADDLATVTLDLPVTGAVSNATAST